MASSHDLLITICARGGSKGVPMKNLRTLLGKPLIQYSIEQALGWNPDVPVVVSTDSDPIAEAAQKAGAQVFFRRPEHLATDSAPKVPVITHALQESEKKFGRQFTRVLDLDPTCPLRSRSDFDHAITRADETKSDVVFSVTPARKNPYFNMAERDNDGRPRLCKSLPNAVVSRQSAPPVYEINGSVYVYSREFLTKNPQTIWDGKFEFFSMEPEKAFDIDEERDFWIVEALAQKFLEPGTPYLRS